jgi:pilus assembly protein CpaF
MRLADRINNGDGVISPVQRSNGHSPAPEEVLEGSFRQLRVQVRARLLKTLDLATLETVGAEAASATITAAINDLLDGMGQPVSETDRTRLISELKNELVGLGPLEPLLWDNEITDILVNGHSQVYIERDGTLQETDLSFNDDQHLLSVIERIASSVGRRIDQACPMLDARLHDGSRIHAVIPPLAVRGPSLSIRRFGRKLFTINDLISKQTLTSEMAEFLAAAVRTRLSVLVVGGAGSGKTTMLNCLSGFIPECERIVTIEDPAELRLQQRHVVTLETRPPDIEGKGEVTLRDLVRNSFRMRPDRIVVGEARGAEVFEMLQAMSTGHRGSLSTLHANSPRDALGRLEMMMLLAGFSIPQRAMRQQISSAINIIVHMDRLSDGSRRVMKISEVSGMEGEMVQMQDLFEFTRTGIAPTGKVLGKFRSLDIRSVYCGQMEAAGSSLNSLLR